MILLARHPISDIGLCIRSIGIRRWGACLLKYYFFESKRTKRQIFWVIDSNINAIKRYRHYGFKAEEMVDYVMINKNIKYEGEHN